jgi:hypothetical protein
MPHSELEAKTTVLNKARMVASIRELGTIRAAANAIGIGRRTHYTWLKEDPEYAEQVADAIEDRVDQLEEEAFRRAHDGTLKPVFQQGMQVGTIREYSDTLMLALLKGNRPDKYKDRAELTGKDGAPLGGELSDVERADRIAAILDAARARRTGPTPEGETAVGAPAGTADDSGKDGSV